MTLASIKYFVMVLGNTMDSHKTFMDHPTISQKVREVFSMKKCDVIIAFVPIVSRSGTDISAAMDKIPHDKPVVLVVLHHTFNQDYVAPDSRLNVERKDVFAVDCVFNEDQGLLRCLRNDDAIRAVNEHLIRGAHRRDDFKSAVPVAETSQLKRYPDNYNENRAMIQEDQSEVDRICGSLLCCGFWKRLCKS